MVDSAVCYHRRMRQLLLAALLVVPAQILAADAVSEARRLYNLGQYDEAERTIRAGGLSGTSADRARVVLGRILLERFRRTADPQHLVAARDALRAADARSLDPRERVELTVGFAEALYFEDRFAAAADLFDL